ncbi:hypothetical protein J4470_00900 [Candidatus Woesearchaeota archaeon]|nr:hypothetical protein [Candidatus Woesearchaeota archaeon]
MVKKITKIALVQLYLNAYGKRYYLRELADLLKKPHQTVKPYVSDLVKESVLTKNERKNIVEYGLNLKGKQAYDYLTIAEKENLIERLKEDTLLKVLFEKLSVFFRKNTFVVFGSAVEKIKKGSDIDLLAIGKQNVSKAVEDFENVYNKKVHKIQITRMEALTLALITEIYKKHLILNNTEQVIRFFGELYEQNKLV